ELTGRRRDGSRFPVDVSLVPFSAGDTRLVGAFVRDATERRRYEDRLRAINEITQRVLAGEPTEATLELVASRARGLVEAPVAWVVVPLGPDDLVISAVSGDRSGSLIGLRLSSAASISRRAMTGSASIVIRDLSSAPEAPAEVQALELGPSLFCPLSGEDRVLGVLVVARARGGPPFTPSDTALVELFANAATVALTLGEARIDLEQLQAASEHERIGRDLHDTVIQRLFALGMGLQSI